VGRNGLVIEICIEVTLIAALWGTLLCFVWRASLLMVGL
jgi:hypothetical protein